MREAPLTGPRFSAKKPLVFIDASGRLRVPNLALGGNLVKALSLAASSLALIAAASAPASAAPILSNDVAAKLFGARPSASAPDLSPDGDKVVFISAGQGPANVVRLLDLKTKRTSDIIASSGKPDVIESCEFATENWIVCTDVGEIPFRASIVGSTRLVAINLNTKQVRNLGADYDALGAATIRQNDGYVISYPAGGPATVVMARYYVQQSNQVGTMGSLAPPISLGVDSIAPFRTVQEEMADAILDSREHTLPAVVDRLLRGHH